MSLDVLEQESWSAGSGYSYLSYSKRGLLLSPRILAHAVRDFCDLEGGIHFSANGFQFTSTLQRGHPLAQIVVGQGCPRFRESGLYGRERVRSPQLPLQLGQATRANFEQEK